MVKITKTEFPSLCFGDAYFDQKKCILVNKDEITHNIEDKGVFIWALAEGLQDPGIEKLVANVLPEKNHPLLFEKADAGICIVLAEKTVVDEPIYLFYEDIFTSIHTVILGSEFSKGSFVEVSQCNQDLKHVSQVLAHKQTAITHVKVQMQGVDTDQHTMSLYQMYDHAHVGSYIYTLGGQKTVNKTQMQLVGQSSRALMDGVFVGKDQQAIENYTKVLHQVPHTESSENYKGILDDDSKGVFQGRVFVANDAQKTSATQMNRNILLSKKANVDTSPELEILADDVKCAHGATVGKMDPEQIFYLQSRGIPKKEAEKMMIRAFVSEVLDEVINDEFTTWMYEKIEGHLHAT